jgi:uncharacterized phage protein gp47/JayE
MAATTPSFDDIVAIGIAEAQDVRPALVFADGDQSTAIVRAGAAMADHIVGWFAGQIRAMFFGGAVGDELDAIIMDRLALPRKAASAARGAVVFARAGAGSADSIPSGFQIATLPDATGQSQTYTTDSALAYPSGAFSLSVTATCSTEGTEGNYDINTQSPTLALIDAPPSSTTAITATTTGFAGGNDAEDDNPYMLRAVNQILTQRRATLAALEEGALDSDADIRVAHAVEDYDTGLVTVRVADEIGGSTREMEQLVSAALEDWRAAGIDVTVQGMHASQLALTITIVDYAPGFDVAAATSTMTDSLVARVNSLRPGQTATLDELRVAIIAPYATQIFKIAFGTGSIDTSSGSFVLQISGIVLASTTLDATADIVPPDGQAIHLTADNVTFIDGKTL